MDFCRICLSTAVTKNLHDLKIRKGETFVGYIEIFSYCLQIELSEESKGRQLCDKCFDRILLLYKFKVLAQKSDAYFRAAEDGCFLQLDVTCDDEVIEEKSLIPENKIKTEDIVPNIVLVEYLEDQDNEEMDSDSDGEKKDEKDQSYEPELSDVNSSDDDDEDYEYNERSIKRTERRDDGTYDCVECNENFPTGAKVYRHVRTQHAKFLCQYCPARFDVKHRFEEHVRLHTNEKPFVCTICGKRFRIEKTWKDHVDIHKSGKKYQCKICDKSFTRENCLRTHQVVHQERRYECHHCKKRFGLKQNLRVHLRNIHHEAFPVPRVYQQQ